MCWTLLDRPATALPLVPTSCTPPRVRCCKWTPHGTRVSRLTSWLGTTASSWHKVYSSSLWPVVLSGRGRYANMTVSKVRLIWLISLEPVEYLLFSLFHPMQFLWQRQLPHPPGTATTPPVFWLFSIKAYFWLQPAWPTPMQRLIAHLRDQQCWHWSKQKKNTTLWECGMVSGNIWLTIKQDIMHCTMSWQQYLWIRSKLERDKFTKALKITFTCKWTNKIKFTF